MTAVPNGDEPPAIAAVLPSGVRPTWSVMIPTFNCAEYLPQTLESVLAQDPGLQEMQIEVVDNCSDKDDPEAVVRALGGDRVAFHRNPRNVGVTANFNICVARSRGHLVHILHGDDYVLPQFYARLAAVAEARPELALYAARTFWVDEDGVIGSVSTRVARLEAGGTDVTDFFYETPTQAAGVVVRRAFYERAGGFHPALVHALDCEMWTRAIATGGGLVLPDVLACYRVYAANDTARLARTAEHLRDIARLNRMMAHRHPSFDAKRGEARLSQMALDRAERFRANGDTEACAANLAFWSETTPFTHRLRHKVGRLVRAVVG